MKGSFEKQESPIEEIVAEKEKNEIKKTDESELDQLEILADIIMTVLLQQL